MAGLPRRAWPADQHPRHHRADHRGGHRARLARTRGCIAGGPAETIGVFSTPGTVASQVYEIEIHKRRPGLRVVSEPCPRLARMIEAAVPIQELRGRDRRHVAALLARAGGAPEKAVLGCTHYGWWPSCSPPPCRGRGRHPPAGAADALARYLAQHPEYRPGTGGRGTLPTTGAGGKHRAPWSRPSGAPAELRGT